MHLSKVANLIHCTWPDSPLGFIDNALKTDIVTEVGNQVQISNDIPNFLPAVELGAPYHGVGNVGLEQGFFNGPGLGIGPVENRKITVFVASFATQLFNRFSNKDCFILLVISPVIDNLFPVFILCPEILRTAVAIVFDDIIGCLQDRLGRAIILF